MAESNEAAIRAVLNRFVRAYNGNDRAGMRALFGPNFVDISAGEPTRFGEAAVELTLKRAALAHSNFTPTLKINSDEIQLCGDWACHRGDLVVSLAPKDGGAMSYIKQRFLEIWHREPDGWKSIVGMDNSES